MSWLSRLWPKKAQAPELDPATVALVDAYKSLEWREREYMIGRLRDSVLGIQGRPMPIVSRYQPRHVDEFLAECEQGMFLRLAIFIDMMRRDGLISGLMGTRTSGMLRRPTLFTGDPYLCDLLKGREPSYGDGGLIVDPGAPGIFDQILPKSEFADIIWDGILAGIGLGENVVNPETGLREARHLDLHWLRLERNPDRLVYAAPGGTYEIRPGDGRWIVFYPKSASRFWMHGAWLPMAMPFISRFGTWLDRLRWQGQLADPLKAIETSDGTTEPQRLSLLRFVMDKWHRSPGFVGRKGEKAYLVESNGRGWEVYNSSDDRAANDIRYVLSGQNVTGEGNKGFSTGDIFEAIKDGIIQETAEAAAICSQKQIIDPWGQYYWGARKGSVRVAWDVQSPAQRQMQAEALEKVVEVVKQADEAFAGRGVEVDLPAYLAQQRIELPLKQKAGAAPSTATPPAGAPTSPDEAPPDEDHAAKLAADMTAHGMTECEHHFKNRCPRCGVERDRGVIPGENGAPHGWKVGAWRPIARSVG